MSSGLQNRKIENIEESTAVYSAVQLVRFKKDPTKVPQSYKDLHRSLLVLFFRSWTIKLLGTK